MARMYRVLGILFLLAACQQQRRNPPPPVIQDTRDTALQIGYDLTPVGKPIEGEMGLVRLKLRNISKTYCLFVKSVIDVESGVAIHWQRSRGGTVDHDDKEDEYRHDRAASDERIAEPLETPPIFNHGFLAPSITQGGKDQFEELDVRLHIRLIRLPRAIRVDYVALNREETRNNVYFPVHRAPEPGKPPAKHDRYARPTEAYLEQVIHNRHMSVAEHVHHKEDVIYPMVVYSPIHTTRVMANLAVKKREFSFVDALLKARLQESDVTGVSYSLAYDSWLFRSEGDKVLMVDAGGATPIGPADLSIFDYMDMPPAEGARRDLVEITFGDSTQELFFGLGEYQVDKTKPREERMYKVIYPVNTRQGVRWFLNLRAPDFREFLKKAGQFGLKLVRDSKGRVSVRLPK